MDLNFFGLQKTPFAEVDSTALFWTPQRRALAEDFRRGITQRQGLLVLTGAEGVGKTSFIKAVLDSLPQPPHQVISLTSDRLSFPLLLRTLVYEIGGTTALGVAALVETSSIGDVPSQPLAPLAEVAPLLHALHTFLSEIAAQQSGPVVVLIDDAHQLPVKTLKDFHWLSTFESPHGKLLQIILVGDSALTLKFDLPQSHILKQRIAVCAELPPLTLEESFVYLLTRLKDVPPPATPLFSAEALHLIARQGKGIPLAINTIANACLRAGAKRRQKPISASLVQRVVAEAHPKKPKEAEETLPVTARATESRSFRRLLALQRNRLIRLAEIGVLVGVLAFITYQALVYGESVFQLAPLKVLPHSTDAEAVPAASLRHPQGGQAPAARSMSPQNTPERGTTRPLEEKKTQQKVVRSQGRTPEPALPRQQSPAFKREGADNTQQRPLEKKLQPEVRVPLVPLEPPQPKMILQKVTPSPLSNWDNS